MSDMNMTLRNHYDDRMDAVRSNVIRMGNLAARMISTAVESVLAADSNLALQVMALDDEVDALEKENVLESCLLVLRDQPVATDFRFLTATIGVIGEFEKIADDAVKLSKRASKLSGGQFPSELRKPLQEVGRDAQQALAACMKLYTAYSKETADEVFSAERATDTGFKNVRTIIYDLLAQQPAEAERLIRVLEVFHALEHVSDRAVVIAKRLKLHNEMREATSA